MHRLSLRRLYLGHFTILFVVVLSATSAPFMRASSALSGAIETARTLLAEEMVAKVPGASVAVAVNGVVVWNENFGYADLSDRRMVTSKTRFRIGSVSKALTAVGLALLIERGQVDLDAPILTYIPDYPEKNSLITVRMLAGHLSGIRNYRPGEALSNLAYPDARTRLKIFEADPLIALPGEKHSYSSYNWNVIEVAIERATRMDFVAFMEANVLVPLSLTDTRAEQPETVDAHQSQFYEIDETGGFILGPSIDNRYAWASGGYLSTAGDLVRFGNALLRPGFLLESSLKTLFTEQKTTDGEPVGYGVGWSIHRQPEVIYHSGWTVGGLSLLLMVPETNTVVVILTNRGGLNISEGHRLYFDIEEIGFKIAQIFSPSATNPAPE